LKDLYKHSIVGDVRGLGLFAGVEFVKDRKTKETFDPGLKLNALIGNRAFDKGLICYPGGGGADGVNGDHILLAPHFIITEEQIDKLVAILDESIDEIVKEQNLRI
jgi:adenosylmethionine-8-amino-7-oxononanoate aminotransferase